MNQLSCIPTRDMTQQSKGLTHTVGQSASSDFLGYAVFKDNPFNSLGGDYQVIQYHEGATVEEITRAACVNNAWLINYLEVRVGDALVPKESWSRVRLKQGAPITIMVIPQGGAVDTLKQIAIIAITVVAATYLGPLGATAMGFTAGSTAFTVASALTAAAVTMAATLAMNAIFPPPVADQPQLGNRESEGQTFGWNTETNKLLQYQSVPRVYGRVKMAPPYAAQPFVESLGDQQYLHLLFDFGYGPLNLTDLQIGENDINTYANIQYKVHPSFKAGDKLDLYNRDVWQDSYSQKITASTFRTVTTQIDSDEAVIDFGFPQGLVEVNAQNGDLYSRTVDLSLQYRAAGSSTWLNFTDLQSTVAGGGTIIRPTNVDYKWEMIGATYADSPRYTNYSSLPDWNTIPADTYITVTTDSSYVDYDGYYQTNVSRQDYYRSNISTSVAKIRVSNKTQKGFTVSVLLKFPAPGQYELRTGRATTDSDSRYISDDVYLTSLRSSKNKSPIAPEVPHTIVEMRLLATDQLNGVINNFTAVATSVLPVWNGVAFVEQETRNPAWIYLDVLRGTAARRAAPDSRIDIAAFAEWAQWCDASAANAVGKPKAQCDMVISGTYTAHQVLKMISATGDATPSLRSGKYSISIDRIKPYPVQMFTPRNSNGFKSSRAYHIQPHGLRVQFVDPNQNWQQREIVVYDDGYSDANATILETMNLVGITNYHHAYRLGRRALAQGRLRQETFSISVGLENILATRGDLVRLAYDVPKIGNGWARIKSINGQRIIIDEQFTNMENGFYIRVRVDNERQVDLLVNNILNDSEVNVDGDMSNIQPGMLITYGTLERITMDCLVKSISPGYDLTADIELMPYSPAIYSAETDPIPDYNPVITQVENVRPGPVVNLQANEVDTVINRNHYISIGLSWSKPAGAQPYYYVIYEWQNNKWREIGQTIERNFYAYKEVSARKDNGEKSDFIGKKMTFAVVGASPGGLRLQPSNGSQVTITPLGDQVKPSKPKTFDLDIRSSTHIYLDWRHSDSNDIDYYTIRYSPNFDVKDINQSTIVADKISYPTNSVTVPARLGTYYIKAVDTTGLISDEYGTVITPTKLLNNEVEVIEVEDATWTGRKSGGLIVDGGELKMPISITPNTGERVGTYYFDDYIDFANIYPVVLSSHVEVEGFTNGSLESIEQYFDVYLEVRSASARVPISTWEPNLATALPDSLAAGSVDMGDWRRLYSGEYTGLYFQFRLTVISRRGDVGVTIKKAKSIGTANIRTASQYDLVCPAAGMRVLYEPPFQEVLSVQITPSDVIEGDTYEIRNKGVDGFDVRFFNNGSPVEKQFDWLVRGYGQLADSIPR